MTTKTDLLTPVGRLVAGSLYEGQTTDAEGKPRTIRTGVNAGQQRTDYYFAIAIAKGTETHWNQTEWGQKIWETGVKGFPGGQANLPHFAWKVQDGDSTTVNRAGRRNCDKEGYPGHWILNFSTGFAPAIYNEDGSRLLTEPDWVKPGDYIQVFGNVSGNESTQQPGVFLNHQMVAFSGHGERIMLGIDPKSVGFGKAPKPAGVLATPPGGFNPAPAPITPYPEILTPPVSAVSTPARVMLPAAKGATYEQMIAAGWTDQLLIQHGMMQA